MHNCNYVLSGSREEGKLKSCAMHILVQEASKSFDRFMSSTGVKSNLPYQGRMSQALSESG